CYEGSWSKVPDFESIKAYATGAIDRFDLKIARRDENFAVRFRGYVDVPQDGTYIFTTFSDDGSVLFLGKTLVVNNDGIHATQSASGSIPLKKGKHAVTVGFIQGGGGAELSVTWEGPGIKNGTIPAGALSHRADGQLSMKETAGSATAGFAVDAALAKRGREVFLKSCVSCHQVEPGDKPIESKPLAVLKEGACKSVNYSLTPKQSTAIASALAKFDPAAKSTAAERIHRTMLALNCFA